MRKKKGTVIAMAIFLAVIVAISAFFVVRKVNYNYGKEQGYFVGYSIGRTDKATGVKADQQALASIVTPYEFGSSKWSGFMRGFDMGYNDGSSGVLLMTEGVTCLNLDTPYYAAALSCLRRHTFVKSGKSMQETPFETHGFKTSFTRLYPSNIGSAYIANRNAVTSWVEMLY